MKILIAEDILLNADTLEMAICQKMKCKEIRKADSGERLLSMWSEWQPDLMIIDLFLPVINGAEAIRKIRMKDLQTPIIAISMYKDRHMIEQALQAGANGFFFKGSDFSKFISAIQAVMAGNRYIDDAILELLFSQPKSSSYNLTQRELEVLNLLAQGKNSEEIANMLNISVATVKFHRSNLLQKSGQNNVAGLVHWASIHGLI